ncbi:ankyrin [Penicillium cosmopolitanum]|uniref:Ankyrin n=1 Tax=Penicillium cosmopolitanum TaxID=1131564 RepID=A0A9W9VQB7_9EURO|nr:ankyrin [Penicillium cosmopolitanum]KAJ5387341.1 ankyrin [Penicillium cosmopolitanum]
MADPGWDLYKSEIERLYIHENKTRDEVMSFMATEYSWNKSGAVYSKKFKEWGLRKHSQPRDDQWISRKVDKRKRENEKESEVFINGVQIHPAKIARSSYRKGFMSEYSRRGLSPSTPEGYVVATPVSPGLQISWNNPLPWIRFMRLLQPLQNDDASLSSSASLAFKSHNGYEVVKGMDFELMQHLSKIVSWNKLQHSPNMHSASRTSAALSILMPENEPGQHDILSADLSTSRAGVREHMSVLLYLISNNLTARDPKEYFEDTLARNDKLVLQILKDTGWNDSKHLEILLSAREPTAESIAERLFAAAVRQENFDIVQRMLQSGMSPNGLIEGKVAWQDANFVAPLQFVSAKRGSVHFINLLISHGADVNFSIGDDGKTALFYALYRDNEAAIRILLDHCRTVTWKCARLAASYTPGDIRDFTLIEKIIDIYLHQDLGKQRGHDTEILQEAVWCNNLLIIERFVDKGANLNGLLPLEIRRIGGEVQHETTLLELATRHGCIGAVQPLLQASVSEYPFLIWPPYISPLDLAVEKGFIDITEVLLGSSADNQAADEGEKTLLERAVPTKNLALCQVLIRYGAKIDREPCLSQDSPSALMIAVQQDVTDIVDLLIGSNARLNDVFDIDPETILGAAVEVGNETMINKLISAGARAIGPRINRIGNLQTAIFLKNDGILPRLLDESGPKLLAAAISAQDNGLAWFLLQRNADKERNKTALLEKTPLRAAIEIHNSAIVLALLERGTKATDDDLTEAIKDNFDLLPILLASFTGSAPTAASAAVLKASMLALELLREANVDLRGTPQMSDHKWDIKNVYHLQGCSFESVLEIAAWKADEVMFKYLLEWASSAQMSWSPESVSRALTMAIFEKRHAHIVELMRLESELSCDIASDPSSDEPARRQFRTYTPLQAAVKTQQASVVRDLIVSKGVNVNYLGEGKLRRTPLQQAVELGNMEIVNLLLENGANVNYLGEGKLRRTPLQQAVELGNMEIVNLLLEYGADVNAPGAYDGGATALQIAAIQGYIGIARRLLDLGSDINQEPARENGRTALMGAAEHGRIDMLQMLLDEGAKVVGDFEGYYYDAIELAEGQGHYAAARLLKSFKGSVELGTL